jgi:hypothetical protein
MDSKCFEIFKICIILIIIIIIIIVLNGLFHVLQPQLCPLSLHFPIVFLHTLHVTPPPRKPCLLSDSGFTFKAELQHTSVSDHCCLHLGHPQPCSSLLTSASLCLSSSPMFGIQRLSYKYDLLISSILPLQKT